MTISAAASGGLTGFVKIFTKAFLMIFYSRSKPRSLPIKHCLALTLLATAFAVTSFAQEPKPPDKAEPIQATVGHNAGFRGNHQPL